MPFTPIHLGPGLAFKALGGRHFSFMVFGGTQVMMDIEPLLGILYDWPILHGHTHTWLGALLVGTLAGLIGRPISEVALRLLQIQHPPFTWASSFAGAYVGAYSHVVLDAIMHADVTPHWPLAGGNGLLGLVSMEALHLACLVLGIAGCVIIGLRQLAQDKRGNHRP